MPIFYRGAGVETHYHIHDARQVGFMARAPRFLLDNHHRVLS